MRINELGPKNKQKNVNKTREVNLAQLWHEPLDWIASLIHFLGSVLKSIAPLNEKLKEHLINNKRRQAVNKTRKETT